MITNYSHTKNVLRPTRDDLDLLTPDFTSSGLFSKIGDFFLGNFDHRKGGTSEVPRANLEIYRK